MQALRREEFLLENFIENVQQSLQGVKHHSRGYLTSSDLLHVYEGIFAADLGGSRVSDSVFVLRAPYDAVVEVADPDEGLSVGQRRFEVTVRSVDDHAIDVLTLRPKSGLSLLSPSVEDVTNYAQLLDKDEGLTELFTGMDRLVNGIPVRTTSEYLTV